MSEIMKGMCVWMFFLLLHMYPTNCRRCREENLIRDLDFDIKQLNNDILVHLEHAYDSQNNSNNFRTKTELLTVETKILEDTNNLYMKIITLLHNQLDGLTENQEIFKTFNKDLETVLKNKEELIKKLEAKNRNLRGEVESLSIELFGWKQSPEKTQIIPSESYTGSPTWQRILLLASGLGDVDEVKFLMDKGVDLNVKDDSPQRRTPLQIAAANGHVEVVRQLLTGGASVNQASSSLNTALHEAASAGHLEVCQLLLDKSATLESHNKYNDTPLKLAKKNGHQNVVNLLISKGAKV